MLIDFNNTFFNLDNEPRLKGKSVEYNNEITEINKGILQLVKKLENVPRGNCLRKNYSR